MTSWLMHIACWILKATNTHSNVYYLLLLDDNNGCSNAPQCYVMRTLLPFFFVLLLGVLWCECDKTHIIVVLTAETFVLSLEPPFS
jgi:hypothetical protein